MEFFVITIVVIILYVTFMWYRKRQTIGVYNDRYVFITGCDSGFGHMLALRLDEMGFHVFAGCLTEKGEDKLWKTRSSRLVTISLDVTNEDSIREASHLVQSKLPRGKGLWGLVNNAGISGCFGPTEWIRREDFMRTFDVNLFGVMETTRVILPLIRRARGRVVNMASILGSVVQPGSVAYCISKHGVEVFSDSLRAEIRQQGVSVHIIEPGYFRTSLLPQPEAVNKQLRTLFDRLNPDVRQFYGENYLLKTIEKSQSILQRFPSKATYKVVDAYVHALTAQYPKARYKVGWDANTIFRLLRMSPEWLTDFLFSIRAPKPAGVF